MLKEGTTAPAFKTTDQNGETVSLKDLRGRKVVLYFYPKDDTPGCTKEACSFRDAFSKFKKQDIVVLNELMNKPEVRQQADLSELIWVKALGMPLPKLWVIREIFGIILVLAMLLPIFQLNQLIA
mgnify:CR=1 FL=1